MREIKFRAWEISTKRMHTVEYLNLVGGIGIIDVDKDEEGDWVQVQRLIDMGDLVLMQYTGLKDKNGKEIYEGDIVQNGNGVYLKIYWNDGLCQFRQRVCSKENVEKQGYKWSKENPTDMDLQFNMKEIIGNIYENPELLK